MYGFILWEKGQCEYNSGKEIKERKRHVIVNTQGLVFSFKVLSSTIRDSE
jgi:hypothetical protein